MHQTEYWVHNLDPVAVHLWGNFGIRYYGLAYALAFILAALYLRLLQRKGRIALTPDQQSTLLTAIIMGVLLGGRLGFQFLYRSGEFLHRPWAVFEIWQGGMSSHGGFIGVALACWWASRRFGVSLPRMGDLMCLLGPQGLLLGRIANFINGELWGKESTVRWAVIFPDSAPLGTPLWNTPPRHPSQLYEAGLEGLALLAYVQWRFWRTRVGDTPGRLSGELLVLYAVARIIGEQFREPDASLFFGMSRGVFYSLFMLAAGVCLILLARRGRLGKVQGAPSGLSQEPECETH